MILPLRSVAPDLAARYRAEGWWNEDTLGAMVDRGLRNKSSVAFNVRSKVHPFEGTFGDVDGAARCLAATLLGHGIGHGDVVIVQMPNWLEAGVTFFAAAYIGAVVVPIVHFYGSKEVAYILEVTSPAAVVTPDRFGRTDYLPMYEEVLRDHSGALWLVARESGSGALPARAVAFEDMLESDPLSSPPPIDPDSPALVAFTSGTTRDPKGVVHTHRTISFETRQLNELFPSGGPPGITGAPVGHFIGMLNAFLIPLLRDRPVNLVDVWDPAEILRLMTSDGLGVGGGATFFLTSLLDHPDFTPAHLELMPFAGLGGSTVPAPFMERITKLGITAYRSYGSTEHPSITGCALTDPEVKRINTDGHTLEGVEIELSDSGEILSRGPDCFQGYTDPALTAAVFDAEGWYHTGDVGVLDEEGYLTITDRISDVIIRGGENISATEVEELLLGIDSIAEVSVVAAPDLRFGEHAAAVFRDREGYEPPTLDQVREHLSLCGLARPKWPESLHRVDEFPRTPSGKVQKFRLRQQLRANDL